MLKFSILHFSAPVVTVILIAFLVEECFCGTLEEDINHELNIRRNGGTNFLSRKRRYITFPEGSSFQIVFCLTYPSIAVGSLFVFGNTAALAWELPSTPIFYNYKDLTTTTEAPTTTTEGFDIKNLIHDDHSFPGGDFHGFPDNPHDFSNEIYSFDNSEQHGQSKDKYDTFEYGNKYRVSSYNNPFADFVFPPKYGYSPQEYRYYGSNRDFPIRRTGGPTPARKPMKPQHYEFNNNRGQKNYEETKSYSKFSYQGNNARSQSHPSRSYIDPMYHKIHRRTRRDLYEKLQQFLTTLNIDGKNCILKAICEVNQRSKEKGTFIEEIIKTIFRVKPAEGYQNEDHFDYAANKTHKCEDEYPSCKGSIFSNMFVFNNKL